MCTINDIRNLVGNIKILKFLISLISTFDISNLQNKCHFGGTIAGTIDKVNWNIYILSECI